MKTETPLIKVLRDVEVLREFIKHDDELDAFLEKVERIDEVLSKLKIVETLLTKIENLEEDLYLLKDYWTTDDLKRYLNVSKSCTYHMSSGGVLPIYKPNDKNVYFKKSEVLEWMGNGRIASTSEIDKVSEIAANRYMLNRKKR